LGNGANPFDFTWRENGARRHLDAGTMASCFLEYLSRSKRWETEPEVRRDGADKKRSEAMRGLGPVLVRANVGYQVIPNIQPESAARIST
jgi:hypothetical protein